MSAVCEANADAFESFTHSKMPGSSGSLKRKIHFSADDIPEIPQKKQNVVVGTTTYKVKSGLSRRRGLSERDVNYMGGEVSKDESFASCKSDSVTLDDSNITFLDEEESSKSSISSSQHENVFSLASGCDSVADRSINASTDRHTHSFTGCHKHMGFAVYIDGQLDYFLQHEQKTHVINFLQHQKEISPKEWSAEVHWLIQLNDKYGYNVETLHLAISIFDRMLSTTSVSADCLKLLAVCSFYIASKQEEVVFPSVRHLLRACKGNYSQREFFKMEREVLGILKFCIHAPTVHHFMEHYSGCKHHPPPLPDVGPLCSSSEHRLLRAKVLARFLTLLTVQDYDIIQYRPSILAAAVLEYAFTVLYKDADWPLATGLQFIKKSKLREAKEDVISLCDPYITDPEKRISEYMTQEDLNS